MVLPTIQLTAASLYVRPGHSLSTNDWVTLLRQLPHPVIIGGDTNTHHTAWGYSYTDSTGYSFIDALDELDYCFLNDGSCTMVPRSDRRDSAPDLTLCSTTLTPHCTWTVLPDRLGSDHLAILTEITMQPSSLNLLRGRKKWKTSRVNWETYKDNVEMLSNKTNIMTFGDLINVINSAALLAIPHRIHRENPNFRGRSRPNFWWDQDCKKAWDEKQRAFRHYKQNINSANYIEVKKREAICRKLFKQKKRESWRKFCDSINKDTPIKYIWEQIKRLKGISVPNKHKIPESLISEFFDLIAPPSAPENIDTTDICVDESDDLNRPFSEQELKAALKSNRNTCPGYDSIQYCMISNLPLSALNCLLRLFNRMWCDSVVDSEWRKIVIYAVVKPGKPSDEATSYRPIALSSCFIKTFERMVKVRLEWFLESNNLIPNIQHGFRKGHNTYDNIADLVINSYEKLSSNNVTLSVFLDIANAYGCVRMSILKDRMMNMGIPGRIIKFVVNVFKERHLYVLSDGGLVGPRSVYQGLDQGAVLSPLLFAIYTTPVYQLVSSDFKITQFADDFTMFASKEKEEEVVSYMSGRMQPVSMLLNEMGFDLAEHKSVAMFLSRRHRVNAGSSVTLGPYTVKVVEKTKFLGMILDRKLLWKNHITYVEKKCEGSLNIIRCINKVMYGSHPGIALQLYRALVLSRIDYGCMFYGSAAKTHLGRLDRLQYRAIRVCLGAMRSTPTNALLCEAAEMPLQLRRNILTCTHITKRANSNGHLLKDQLDQLLYTISTSTYWRNKPSPIMVNHWTKIKTLTLGSNILSTSLYSKTWHIQYMTNNIFAELGDLHNVSDEIYASFVTGYTNENLGIYTDGSKTSQGVGSAFLDSKNSTSQSFKLLDRCSVFTSEGIAIKMALIYVASLDHIDSVTIFSDSKSVLTALKTAHRLTNPLLVEIQSLLFNLSCRNITVNLIWVKSHNNNKYNEAVDSLAKTATTCGTACTDITPQDIITHIKRYFRNKWQQLYNQSKVLKGKYYCTLQPHIPQKPWFNSFTLHRQFFSTIIRLRLNHTRLPSHLFKIGLIESASCGCDGISTADANHVLLSCPLTAEGRQDMFNELVKHKVALPTSISHIVSHTSNIHVLQALYTYIVLNNIPV